MLFKRIYKITIYLFIFGIILLGIFLTENNHRRNIDRFVDISLEKEIREINQIELLGNQPELFSKSNLITIDYLVNALGKLEQLDDETIYMYFNNKSIDAFNKETAPIESFGITAPNVHEMSYRIDDNHALLISSKILFSDLTFDRIKVIDMTSFYHERISSYVVLIITGLTIVLLTAILYYVFSKRLIKPVDTIVNHLKKISQGEYSKRLIVEDSDDYENIIHAVNDMQEKVLESSNALIEQNNRQSLFIRNMNHEIRTPITSIIGYSELLVNDKANDTIKNESAQFIKEEGRRLTQLSKKLSQIMMVTDYQLDRQTLHAQDLKKHLQSLYRHHDRQEDIHYYFANVDFNSDLDLLVMFYVNLIDNAIKASKPNETISVYLTKEHHHYLLSVVDEGIGFDDELVKLAYEPFVKGSYNKNESGTGLGLHICHKISTLLKGTLTIVNNEEKGATVKMEVGHD